MSQYCFGVDVGGTSVKLGLFDKEGTMLDKWEVKTRTTESGTHILPDAAASILAKMKEKSLSKEDILGVGVGVPGPVDGAGCVSTAVNLGWSFMNVKATMEELLGMHVEAGNDANVAALGEMWRGGGQGHKNLVAVTLGTGVGGGIIINGHILTGINGSAGEIGHVHVEDAETEVCCCGNKGCLEQFSSATGIVRLAKRTMEATQKATILSTEQLSAKSVFDAVKAGDEVAIEIAEQFGAYLGKALAVVAGVIDPEIFVIGGGVSKAGEVILTYIKKYYIPNVFVGSRNAIFALATLGNDAGIYGAARMVLE
ncbi:MAG: ROK family glucokinase [Lachnospiraceae bacterium]